MWTMAPPQSRTLLGMERIASFVSLFLLLRPAIVVFFLPPEEGNLSEMCNFALSKPRPVRPAVCLA